MKQSPIARVLLVLIFVGLLATPAILRKLAAAKNTGTAPLGTNTSLARYGFYLEESAKASGIDFVHQAPHLDSKLDHIMPQIASMGASVTVVDFDRDGWQDIYVTNSGEGTKNHLYRNLGNGKFKDVAEEMGIADLNQPGTGVCMGAVWGDYDNDGYEDLFVNKWGRPELFHNEGGKKFTRVTEQAKLPAWLNSNAAVWLDYDGDGKLDLFIAGYYPENLDLWHLKDTRIMPDSFEYAKNGGRRFLMHNLGNGVFEDVTAKMGIDSHRWALAVTAADLRGTGYPDIFVANDYGYSEIYANQGGKGFKEVGKESLYYDPLGTGPKSGMNASIGDIQNSGKFAVYVSNISEEGQLIQGNNLWIPKPGKEGNTVQYDELAKDMGVDLGGWSFGAQFGDLNNDGNQDLYVVNGYISADRNASYWYDYSKISGAHGAIITDAKNWPVMGNQSLSGFQQKKLWINDGAGRFNEVAQAVGAKDIYDGRSVALGDFENKGKLDIVVSNQKGPLLLYKNTVTPDNKWVDFELEGTKSNRSAIGAQVRVFWNGQQQLQEVSGGSGFCAQNQRRLHFGLGKAPKIEKVEVRWPSGKIQTLPAPETGKINKVKEPV
jgi:hypothetical protein